MNIMICTRLEYVERTKESIAKIEDIKKECPVFAYLNNKMDDSEDELNRVWDTLDSIQSFIEGAQNIPEFEDDWALPELSDMTFNHFKMLCNIRLHEDKVSFQDFMPFTNLMDSLLKHLYGVLKSLLGSSYEALELFLKKEGE